MGIIGYIAKLSHGGLRILRISKRPTRKQFTEVLRATGIGLLIIGILSVILRILLLIVGIGIF